MPSRPREPCERPPRDEPGARPEALTRQGVASEGTAEVGAIATPPELAARLAAGLLDEGAPPGRERLFTAGLLDPACGEGGLLLAAWEASGRDRSIALRLHGIELDPARAERARRRIAAALGPVAGPLAAANVITADALDPRTPWPAGCHVLANPPWVSLSGRQTPGALPPEPVARWRRMARTSGGWPSLHGLFLERIAAHVAHHHTRARVLLPASVASHGRYGSLRAAVTHRSALPGAPEELGEQAFDGVLEPALLLELDGARVGDGSPLPWLGVSPSERPWLDRMTRFPPLPREAFADIGVHTGNAAGALLLERAAPGAVPVREGRDLAAFSLAPPRRWLRTDLERSAERRFRIAPLDTHRAVPVLLRQTADRPIAARHVRPTHFRNSLLACSPPPDLDPRFVVGVLNSERVAAWHRARWADARQRAFPQVKIAHLRALPFPLGSRAEDAALHDAVVRATSRLEASPTSVEALAELERHVARAYGASDRAL